MTTIRKLNGTVWLNDDIQYSGVAPRFKDSGLTINRLKFVTIDNAERAQINSEGPHFDFLIPDNLLINIPIEDIAQGAKYSFSGPSIGFFNMRAGYLAIDMGMKMRKISHYDFLVSVKEQALQICITGNAGPVMPLSNKWPDDKSIDSQNFKIEFTLPAESFSSVFNKPISDTLTRNLKSASIPLNKQPTVGFGS